MGTSGTSRPPVVFWWNAPSIHMEPCLRAFSRHWGAPTLAVWSRPLAEARKALGWREASVEGMRTITLPGDEDEASREIRRIVAGNPGAVHVYSGWRGHRRAHYAFRVACLDKTALHVVVAEPFRGWGIRRMTRHGRALWQTLPYRGRINGVLAISESGERFYQQLGFPQAQIHPFMYQAPAGKIQQVSVAGDAPNLIYVGRFEPRKGLDDLLAALGRLRHRAWTLSVVGDGPRRGELESLARRCGVDARIRWMGSLPSDSVPACLAQHDLALVPSRFDGWGVVTNEALQAGIPVIVSDRTGSCDLVRASHAGLLFRAGDVDDLVRVLDGPLSHPAGLGAMKAAAERYRPGISGESVAVYLAGILTHIAEGSRRPPPHAPWKPRGEFMDPDRQGTLLRELGT